MKKFFLITFLIVFVSISTQSFAGVNVQLNGNNIDFTDANGQRVDAQIINSRTMVPMRKIFELLDATVDWEASTRTVKANKDGISIKLQIDNEIAEITKNGKTEKIKLDSKPIIVDGRTLVPLRFISESLGKQVGWDSANTTAIIIDYDYFANRLKEKSPILYEFITDSPDVTIISILRTYTDLTTSASKTSKAYAYTSKPSNNSRNIDLIFSGTSELFTEIANEGWGNVSLSLNYSDKGVGCSTTNQVLSKTLNKNMETYDELQLKGKYDDSFSDMIKNKIGVSDSSLNIGTFSSIKSDFDKLLNVFSISDNGTTATIKANALTYSNSSNFKYFDYTDFDNIIFNNEFILIYNTINKLIFNYDVNLEELLYDYPSASASFSLSRQDGGLVANGRIELKNDYNEKVVFAIDLNQK